MSEDSTILDRPGREDDTIPEDELHDLPQIPGFFFEEEIGSGGMGRVFRARDEVLDRKVAVKILRSDDPETLARFAREARAQARIQDDHVCPVFEVGEVDGRPYIVMALVEGRSLLDAAEEMGNEAVVAVMADVADALHSAHRTGLIHRDVKPSNIMVEPTEDGGWHGWIMDFGIAQEPGGEELTVTGATIGTPAFMAPEQIKGGRGRCDRRTDVYGLGATLYSVLTGKPPYEGNALMDLLINVSTADPVRPRQIRPEIPRDLETIILKCMEREPARRYESAAALAADLRRFLNGEPILARRAEWSYRLAKMIRKHRVLTAVVAVSVVTVGTIGGLALHSVVRTRREAAVAREFARDVRDMETTMQKAALLPLHDIRPAIAEVDATMAGIEARMEDLGDVAEGPGRHALGSGHLVLREYEGALADLETAWKGGYQNPETAFALGMALGRVYQKKRAAALQMSAGPARAEELDRIRSLFRDPALEYLQSASDLDPAGRTYVEGLIALYEERFDDALDLADRVLQLDPTRYEARLLEADVEIERGSELFEAGEVEASTAAWGRARAALEEAALIGRSDPAVYRSRCRLATMVLMSEIRRGTAVEEGYRSAVETCSDGLRINPDDVGALSAMSQLSWRWGTQLIKIGDDPVPVLEQAIEMALRAVSIEPDHAPSLNNLGVARSKLALNDFKAGQDPTEHLRSAIEAFDRAIEAGSIERLVYNNRGLAWWQLGQWRMAVGEDPLSDLEKAAGDFRSSLEIFEDDPLAMVNLGGVLLTTGMYRAAVGLDPVAAIDESIAVLDRTIEINPRMAVALNSLGAAHCTRGEWLQRKGEDPRPSLDRAIEAFEKSATENPNSTVVYSNIGSAAATRARYELDVGIDPTESVREASEWLEKAIKLNPRNTTAYFNRASVRRLDALYRIQHGMDPSEVMQDALDDLDRVEAINPGYRGLGVERIRIKNLEARRLYLRGRDPGSILRSSLKMIEDILAEDPSNAEALIEDARIHLLEIQWTSMAAAEKNREISEGLAAIDRALSIDSRLADAHELRGSLFLERALGSVPETDVRGWAAEAVSAFETALEINPLLRRKIGKDLEEARKIAQS